MSDQQKAQGNEQDATQQQFAIQRIYVKDISFEAPSSPQVFQIEWKPAVELELNSQSKQLAPEYHEVVLRVSVTAKIDEKVAFLAEVQQAGVFMIANFTDDQTRHMLGSYCPMILFPYIREVIADVINRGGFPQFNLAPVNFDALYAQHLEEMQAKAEGEPVQA